ncbi:hypothetical protein PR048_010910 [Dryococelus australis]|uniref:Uncharacterized protein n=1 Tax=Dryococelus australis TaxID=614101 RepID=A0ABQ9I407_9NEOP|nr:hypothetical protein PR048_010910 [Dryococelus australis]
MELDGNERAGKQEILEKTRRPAASSGTVPTCENPARGHDGLVVRLLASHHGDPGSAPGGVASGLQHLGNVVKVAVERQLFSGCSRFPALAYDRLSIYR